MILLSECLRDGLLDPSLIAKELRTSKVDVIRSAGSGTQRSLRAMLDILDIVTLRFGNPIMAYAWYRSEALPGFSGSTCMQLVAQGRASEVIEYVEAVDAGIYA
ncbi:hypothetical protein BMI91_00085 [Thioclava sediminum]|uniref:Antitoxin Xre/MbcA/ParS-like toxin-binding domain-containing protein n=1 Tax=Thioclava sediminum TaxID=1915319 RepID=A0ABX3N359_9RHOB|nr:hypothetical protein [Thioclava sediminum]OOY24889.1 hypothetical protein BMI91_00085 [Thioclava sediminum]